MTGLRNKNSISVSVKACNANRSTTGVVPGDKDDLFAAWRECRSKFVVISLPSYPGRCARCNRFSVKVSQGLENHIMPGGGHLRPANNLDPKGRQANLLGKTKCFRNNLLHMCTEGDLGCCA